MLYYRINFGCRKREAHNSWSMGHTWKGSTRIGYWNYLEDYWSSACGISVLNAIGAQMCDLIKLGTDPMAVGGIKK